MATILCDLDGTLLTKSRPDPPGVVSPKRAAINRALAEVCAVEGVDFVQGIEHGLTDWQIAERAVRRLRADFALDGECWQRVAARAEAVFAPETASGEAVYRALPGVPAVLTALREAGHELGLVTGNLALFALYKLRSAGIDPSYFTGPAAFGDHGRERVQIVRAALARSAGGPLVVLGDTEHDRTGAAVAGLPFLGTGAMGLARAAVVAAPGSPAAWVADLADAAAVLACVEELVEGADRE